MKSFRKSSTIDVVLSMLTIPDYCLSPAVPLPARFTLPPLDEGLVYLRVNVARSVSSSINKTRAMLVMSYKAHKEPAWRRGDGYG